MKLFKKFDIDEYVLNKEKKDEELKQQDLMKKLQEEQFKIDERKAERIKEKFSKQDTIRQIEKLEKLSTELEGESLFPQSTEPSEYLTKEIPINVLYEIENKRKMAFEKEKIQYNYNVNLIKADINKEIEDEKINESIKKFDELYSQKEKEIEEMKKSINIIENEKNESKRKFLIFDQISKLNILQNKKSIIPLSVDANSLQNINYYKNVKLSEFLDQKKKLENNIKKNKNLITQIEKAKKNKDYNSLSELLLKEPEPSAILDDLDKINKINNKMEQIKKESDLIQKFYSGKIDDKKLLKNIKEFNIQDIRNLKKQNKEKLKKYTEFNRNLKRMKTIKEKQLPLDQKENLLNQKIENEEKFNEIQNELKVDLKNKSLNVDYKYMFGKIDHYKNQRIEDLMNDKKEIELERNKIYKRDMNEKIRKIRIDELISKTNEIDKKIEEIRNNDKTMRNFYIESENRKNLLNKFKTDREKIIANERKEKILNERKIKEQIKKKIIKTKEKIIKSKNKIDICEPIEQIEGIARNHIDEINFTMQKIVKNKQKTDSIELQNSLDSSLIELTDEKKMFNDLIKTQIKNLKDDYSCNYVYEPKIWKKSFYQFKNILGDIKINKKAKLTKLKNQQITDSLIRDIKNQKITDKIIGISQEKELKKREEEKIDKKRKRKNY